MRILAAALAVVATLSLSGCMWWADSLDQGSGDSYDPEVAIVFLGIAVIVGIVLVVVNLSNQGGTAPPPSPPLAPVAPPNAGWQEVEETVAPARAPAKKAAPKTARRRAP
ncbi:MAG: hypothetical protein WC876_12260 [Candidatus Thermoplasmatota archaeon]|jgi:hypothetical protein